MKTGGKLRAEGPLSPTSILKKGKLWAAPKGGGGRTRIKFAQFTRKGGAPAFEDATFCIVRGETVF